MHRPARRTGGVDVGAVTLVAVLQTRKIQREFSLEMHRIDQLRNRGGDGSGEIGIDRNITG